MSKPKLIIYEKPNQNPQQHKRKSRLENHQHPYLIADSVTPEIRRAVRFLHA